VNAGPPKRGGTLVIGAEKEPNGIDLHKSLGGQGVTVLSQIYQSMLIIDDEGNLIPGLAVSMPEQPDPATYIFTLRKGVKFHNGADFDARDVKFSFDRLMNKKLSRYYRRYQELIKSVEILDPYKVKITLKKPNIMFLDFMGRTNQMFIVPRGAPDLIKHPIATGPFKFVEWRKDDRITLVRHERYWEKGLPYLDKIVYKTIPEKTTRFINLKTAQIVVMHTVSPTAAIELKKEPGIKVLGRPGGQTSELWFNTTKYPFNNKKVRQAFAYGIDREAIAESAFSGLAEVAYDLFPSWHFAHNPNIKAYPYDPEKAKALLKEAGYKLKGKKRLRTTLLTVNETPLTDQAVIIQAQLEKIGVSVSILAVEKPYRSDAAYGRRGRDYEFLLEDMSDDQTEAQWTYRIYGGKSFSNHPAYNSERYGKKGQQNPEVEALFAKIFVTPDRDQRRRMYDDLQKMIIDDVPGLRLNFRQNVVAMRGYVKNHKILTRDTVPLQRVWVEK
jgi:peptide/nickel transport system substrate-binding protein